ncbi:hypothetical protein [Clostridium cibarium]|uniref:Phage protein n=1 Tax=Clostridium cibarium TaxID=2762247 RepID=A0ABR8PWC6_9CLOT|nr:hypothetical protein [Clostridium cibarium]MBD7912471.1 hypothetical protein [Clostridium cibarium]
MDRYKKITSDGIDIVENQIGILETKDGWQFFCINERGGVEVIEKHKIKEDAISHMIEGLRVEKRIAERRLMRMNKI